MPPRPISVTLAPTGVRGPPGPPGTGGGGGGFAVGSNWCSLAFASTTHLTPGAGANYQFLPSEVTITSQSGSDFSIVDYIGVAALRTAGGGTFQMAAILNPATDATLDLGYTSQRWLNIAIGAPGIGLPSIGIDVTLPILVGTIDNKYEAGMTQISDPMMVAPGGYVTPYFLVALIAGVGTDSVPIGASEVGLVNVWQVAA